MMYYCHFKHLDVLFPLFLLSYGYLQWRSGFD